MTSARCLRAMTAEDVPAMLALIQSERYVTSAWFGLSEQAAFDGVLEQTGTLLRSLAALPQFKAWVYLEGETVAGFAVLLLDQKDTITETPVALVYGHVVRQELAVGFWDALLPPLEATAGQTSARLLCIDVLAERPWDRAALQAHGYSIYRYRIVKTVDGTPASATRTIRMAEENDRLFVLWVNSVCYTHILPPGDHDLAHAYQNYLQHYSSMALAGPDLYTLMAEDDDGLPIGFVMVQISKSVPLTSEPVGYVYDIEVHPDYWGKGVADELMLAAEASLADRGVRIFLADISGPNIRPLKTATRSLGFRIRSERWYRTL